MKGSEAKLVSYMQGSDKRFVIPVYQRNYDWRLENCKQLFDDLVKIIKKERRSHFFGSIVSVHSDGDFNEFQVIDGQQRLTTISLLFLAMYNLMQSGIIVPAQGNLADRILKTYLIDEWQEDETRIKLKPVKNDSKAFGLLFGNTADYIYESNLTINYNYFYTRIQKEEVSIDELYTAITRLEIINITLNHEDNPQLIFESLNSTGLALSEGDKIRNFILMGLPTKLQNKYYEEYWNKIEICTAYNVSMFIRDYLSVKQLVIPAISRVYLTFKSYVEDEKIATEDLLIDMYEYAKRYLVLLKGNTSDKALNACILRLNRLETSVTRPFFLEVLRMYDEKVLSIEDVRKIFIYTENYCFRRTICDLPSNALNKLFLLLHREIIRFDGTSDNYLEKFKYAVLSKSDRLRFPDDTEFVESFSSRQIYSMNGKNKIYIFERLENNGTIEDKDIYRHCDDGTYSIEHIMPQHLTPLWVEQLGSDYEEIHEIWLHRIANLTLTGYNSNYSNSSFVEKKNHENGFIKSGLRMNTWIAQQDKWTIEELENRNQLLMSAAVKIWSLPSTTFVPAEKQLDTYTLDDDVELSGREILRFEYKNTTQPVNSWISMMEQVVKILHDEDNSVLTVLARTYGTDNDLDVYFSHDPSLLRGALKLEENMYMERNTSTTTKISVLKRLFKMYGANPEDLIFYLKAPEDVAMVEEGSRFETRIKYWSFALDYVHAAHGEFGSFCNANPSKENWLCGFLGVNGFHISLIANYDHARVELVLGKSDKQKNKSAFDYLYAHKDEISKQINNELVWARKDDGKQSFIYCKLSDVSIANETDWIQMSKFHAEVSKKFYDAFVPYLKEWNV